MACNDFTAWGKKIAATILLVGVFPVFVMAHEFFISITSIQHQPKSQKLSVRVKLYINALETSILADQGVRLNLRTDRPLGNAQTYVEAYMLSRLAIAINDKPVILTFINQQVELSDAIDDSVLICQLEAYGVSEIDKIKVHNSILTEAFDSQTNIVHIRANKTRKAINLDQQLPEDYVTYR